MPLGKDLSFGERHVVLSVYEGVEYDGRTRKGKLARKMAQMRLATASNDDLVDLARHELHLFGAESYSTWQETLERLIDKREMLQSGRLR